MDMMLKSTSYGNGKFYAKTYDGELDSVGFDTLEEAWAELEYVACGIVDAELVDE